MSVNTRESNAPFLLVSKPRKNLTGTKKKKKKKKTNEVRTVVAHDHVSGQCQRNEETKQPRLQLTEDGGALENREVRKQKMQRGSVTQTGSSNLDALER
jgi:hypothetical protein